MGSERPPVVFDEDNPEWTKDDLAKAAPASSVLPAEVIAAFRPRGRPKGSLTSNKRHLSLRLDIDVVEAFKAGGPGWQTRINDALRAAISRR